MGATSAQARKFASQRFQRTVHAAGEILLQAIEVRGGHDGASQLLTGSIA
jgi:hypothetical protein